MIPAGFSPQEYLALERQAVTRHEYRRGLVYAMAGSTAPNHNRIALNLTTQLSLHLSESCQFFSRDIKVNYDEDFYYYPDVFVTCDSRNDNDLATKCHPNFIVEVLSKSTQQFDRKDIFEDYKLINTLKEYVLISQDKMQVARFCLQPDGSWQSTVFGRSDHAIFTSIGIEIAVLDLYQGTSVR